MKEIDKKLLIGELKILVNNALIKGMVFKGEDMNEVIKDFQAEIDELMKVVKWAKHSNNLSKKMMKESE